MFCYVVLEQFEGMLISMVIDVYVLGVFMYCLLVGCYFIVFDVISVVEVIIGMFIMEFVLFGWVLEVYRVEVEVSLEEFVEWCKMFIKVFR